MNALMNIQVRVLSAQAMREFAKLSAAQQALIASNAKAAAASGGMASASTGGLMALEKWGNKAQWAGRQLTYNFTMPLMLAAGAGAKFALDNEQAMVRVQKVYGDATHGSQFYRAEITELGKAFEMLSNQYGVNRAEVINIAADWAAAGASGVALAKSTKLTLDTMILGEMNQVDATKALISIQAQYGESTDQLSRTIDVLNMVENQTGISMEGLIMGFQRAAGVARDAGIDVRHLAALMAALVPSAGTAEQAGNAIKTIVSRILSPTKEAAQVLGLMGTSVKELGWNSLNGSQRLESLATAFNKLTGPQKAVVSTTLASRFQINKFSALMRDISNPLGYYQRALDSTVNAQANFNQKVSELNQVLTSNPQRLKIIWTTLQNAMADVVQPMLPFIVSLVAQFVSWAKSFQNLNPGVQKLILSFLGLLALLGPVLKYLGSIGTVIGYLGGGLKKTAGFLFTFVGHMWELAIWPFITVWTGLTKLGSGVAFLGRSVWNTIKMAGAGLVGMFANLVPQASVTTAAEAASMEMIATSQRTETVLIATSQRTGTALVVIAQSTGTALVTTWREIFTATNIGFVQAEQIITTNWEFFHEALLGITTGFGTVFLSETQSTNTVYISQIQMLQRIITALWTQIYSTVLAITGGLLAITATYNTNLLAITAKTAAGVVEIWTTNWVIVEGIFTTAYTVIIAEATVFYTNMLGITTGFSTALVSTWVFTWESMTAIAAAAEVILEGEWWAAAAAIEAGYVQLATASGGMAASVATSYAAIGTAATASVGVVALANSRMVVSTVVASTTVATAVPTLLSRIGPAIMGIFTGIGGTVARIGPLLFRFLTGPWGLAITAIFGILYNFRDRLGSIWSNVVSAFQGNATSIGTAFAPLVAFFNKMIDGIESAFWRLPAGIRDAFMAVVKIVSSAAKAVYNMFSYFNPFAKHSPSLVDNVKKGMAVVGSHYETVTKPGVFKKATSDITAHKTALASVGAGPFADEKANVTKGIPSMLPLFNSLMLDLTSLNKLLVAEKATVDSQQGSVDKWKSSLNKANAALDIQKAKLDGLQANLDNLTTAYDAHKTALDTYASAPLAGMKAVNDAIFDNSMAQKKLQLQMAQMGDAGNIDKLRNKFALLQGEIEKLSGTQGDLRKAGAGSEILGSFDAQINALRGQQQAVNSSLQPIADMQTALEALQHQADIMDLQKSLQFDPLLKQIDEVVNVTKELTFAEIIAGVTKERDAMNALQPSIDIATLAVKNQQAAVDALTVSRDAVSARYDIENAKLSALNDEYSKTTSLVSDIEQALRDMGSAATDAIAKAKAAKETLTPGAQNFVNAGKADFPSVGGDTKVGREGGIADQSKAIDDWMKKNNTDLSGAFGKIDMFKPIKDMWNAGWKWMETNVAPSISAFGTALKQSWNNLTGGIFSSDSISGGLDSVSKTLSGWWDNGIKPIIDLFAPDFKKIWGAIIDGAMKLWNEVGPEVAKFGELFGPLWKALQNIGIYLAAYFIPVFKILVSMFASTVGPVIDLVIDYIKGFVKILRGMVEFVLGVLSGDWSKAWQGIVDVVTGIFGYLGAAVVGVLRIAWGLIAGFVGGWIGLLKAIWDKIGGGIRDFTGKAIQWFKDMGSGILTWIVNLGAGIIGWFQSLPGAAASGLSSLGSMISNAATTAWNWFLTASVNAFVAVINWVISLPGQIVGGLVGLFIGLRDFVLNVMSTWMTLWADGMVAFIVWVKSLPQAIYDGFFELKDKIGLVASEAWAWFTSTSSTLWNGFYLWVTGLPQKAYDGLIALKERIGSVASTAWAWFSTTSSNAWNGFYTWITGLPQKAWNGLIALKDRLVDVASTAWTWFSSTSSNAWNGFYAWITGLPQAAWNGIIAIKDKFIDVARTAFQALKDKAVDMVDGKGGLMEWIRSIPGKIASALGSIGSAVANAVKDAWNGMANWINVNGIANINKVGAELGFHIGDLPTFAAAQGGIVPGGQSKKDNVFATLRSGEGIIIPEAVSAMGGARGLSILNTVAANGGNLIDYLKQVGVEGFKDGGVAGEQHWWDNVSNNIGSAWNATTGKIGDISGAVGGWLAKGAGYALSQIMGPLANLLRMSIPGDSITEKFMANTLDKWAASARTWGDKKDAAKIAAEGTLGSGTLGSGWQAMWALVSKAFPNAQMTSGFRPFSGTSYHAQGRAIDIAPPSMAIFDWIAKNYGANSKELIYSPAGARAIKDGKAVGMGFYGPDVTAAHYNHVHWAYDEGGYLKPGMTNVHNSSGKPEPVFSAAQWSTVRSLVLASANILKSSGVGAGGSGIGLQGTAFVNANARMGRASATQSTQGASTVNNKTEYHFHGDLSFPNIKSGEDAEVFLKNLKSLAGGK